MYIFQKNYGQNEIPEKEKLLAVVITPSTPKQMITRFQQIVKETFEKINNNSPDHKWELRFLNKDYGSRTANSNYSSIYYSNVIIAECTEQKPNIFYLIGLAHACGKPVCSCYMISGGKKANIPFNVHGRQNLIYSINTVDKQHKFSDNLKDWIIHYEKF